jgi:serine/threonine-protein kinase RsbT
VTPAGPAPIALGVVSDADLPGILLLVGDEATKAGLGPADRARAVTAAAELTTNILKYAGRGIVTVARVVEKARSGIEIVAEDRGPGIADVQAAMKDHFSTSGTLGLGLPGVRRMMDEFEMVSTVGKGTRVRVRKWAA